MGVRDIFFQNYDNFFKFWLVYDKIIIPAKWDKINIVVIKSTFNITFGIIFCILPLKSKFRQNTYNMNYTVLLYKSQLFFRIFCQFYYFLCYEIFRFKYFFHLTKVYFINVIIHIMEISLKIGRRQLSEILPTRSLFQTDIRL